VWSAPLQCAVALGGLYMLLGPSGFGGLLVMLVLMPVNVSVPRDL
jgi:hypothetical protein